MSVDYVCRSGELSAKCLFDEFAFYVVVNASVTGKSSAAVFMPRHGAHESRVFGQAVEVAYERTAGEMAAGHFMKRILAFCLRYGVEDTHAARHSARFQQRFDSPVVAARTCERQ